MTLYDKIETIIDHYTPYRPVTDSVEAIEVRKVLAEVSDDIKQAIKELKFGDLYRELINKYGKAEIWNQNINSIIDMIEWFVNNKINKIFGEELTQ